VRPHLKLIAAVAIVAVVGMFSLPVAAEGFVLTGTVSPEITAPGGTLTVTYTAGGRAGACDEYGPDAVGPSNAENEVGPAASIVTYSNRQVVFGLFPQSVALNSENYPSDWYDTGTPPSELGYVTSFACPSSTYDQEVETTKSGWQGTVIGTVRIPDDIPPGVYNAVWGCGAPRQLPAGAEDTLFWDTGSPAISRVVTVTGTPAPHEIALTLGFSAGSNIRNGDALVSVSGGGLLPGATYTVIQRSDPVQIGTGVVGATGLFSASLPIFRNTPGGAHSVTVTSLNLAGEVVSAVAWFYLDENGTVVGTSYDGPIAPRFTG